MLFTIETSSAVLHLHFMQCQVHIQCQHLEIVHCCWLGTHRGLVEGICVAGRQVCQPTPWSRCQGRVGQQCIHSFHYVPL